MRKPIVLDLLEPFTSDRRAIRGRRQVRFKEARSSLARWNLGLASCYTVHIGKHSKPRAAWQHTEPSTRARELQAGVAFA
jgi:uncharacterized protein (DUF427 family)